MPYCRLANLVLALALSGCSGEAATSDESSLLSAEPGWLIVDWKIEGERDVTQCDRAGAATIALTVRESSGASEPSYRQTCLAFNATIALAPGSYTAQGVLLDAAGAELTVPVSSTPFEIATGAPAWNALEFPESSFHGSVANR